MKYFVSYLWTFNVFEKICDTLGRCEIERTEPITCIKDIEEIERQIAADKNKANTLKHCGNSQTITVLSWQPFEK